MKKIAIIPARSGSKGLQDKNIKLLNDKPLLAYTIEAAHDSGIFDEVMVSTDSKKYAEIAKQFGAAVPFLRSKETSGDTASSWDAVREVLQNYAEIGCEFDMFCLLQPTSPLRDGEDIEKAYKMFCDKAEVAIVSVCPMEHSPKWSNGLDENYSLDGFISTDSAKRRQDISQYYRLNGAIYMVNVKAFVENEFLYRKGSYAYVMSSENSVDIDTELDFVMAEAIMKWKQK